jgi:hypothetical protein
MYQDRIIKSLILITCLTSVACIQAPRPQPTALELQSIQSREFETNKTVAFASVISVFQDLGYIIKGAEKETGFITAKSTTRNASDFFDSMNSFSTNIYTNATAFIEELRPGFTKIRLNFVVTRESSSSYGQNRTHDEAIIDPKTYVNAFEKIEDAIFIRQ